MTRSVKLKEFAYGRSGDKGSDVNIGIATESDQGYEIVKAHVTPKSLEDFFTKIEPTSITRYELPNLRALNFVLENALEGGGTGSLKVDSQGKALAQALLEMSVELNDDEVASLGL